MDRPRSLRRIGGVDGKQDIALDEPCAIATTLMLLYASAENTRAAIPALPPCRRRRRHDSDAGAGPTLSITPLASFLAERVAHRPYNRAALGLRHGKPMELSDEA